MKDRIMDSPIAITILLCLIDNSWTTKASAETRVAVIGGGIGGTTAALFLREELGDDVDILIYEKDNRHSDRHRGTWRQVLRIWRRRNSSQKSIHVKSDKDAGIASRRGLPDPLDFRPLRRPKHPLPDSSLPILFIFPEQNSLFVAIRN